jgi:hypothetical protein
VPADPAYVYGLQLGQVLDEAERLQELEYEATHADQSGSKVIYRKAEAHQSDISEALRGMIASVRATTLEGSAVQIANAISIVALIEDQYPEKAMTYKEKCQFRALDRLLFSALHAINEQTGGELAKLHSTFFGVGYCDPWRDTDETVVENIRAGQEAEARQVARKGGAV